MNERDQIKRYKFYQINKPLNIARNKYKIISDDNSTK